MTLCRLLFLRKGSGYHPQRLFNFFPETLNRSCPRKRGQVLKVRWQFSAIRRVAVCCRSTVALHPKNSMLFFQCFTDLLAKMELFRVCSRWQTFLTSGAVCS